MRKLQNRYFLSGCIRKSMQKKVDRVVAEVLPYSTRITEPELKLLRVTLDKTLTNKERQLIDQYRDQAKVMIDSMMNFQMKLSELEGNNCHQTICNSFFYLVRA